MTDSILRDVCEADLPFLFEHQADPDACRMAVFRPRERAAFMEHWKKTLADAEVTKRAIVVGSKIAGSIVAFNRSGQRQVGYWLGKEFWGKGIATLALTAFLLVETTRPLYARVATSNRASIRILEKCGFQVSHHERPPADEHHDEVDEVVMMLGNSG